MKTKIELKIMGVYLKDNISRLLIILPNVNKIKGVKTVLLMFSVPTRRTKDVVLFKSCQNEVKSSK